MRAPAGRRKLLRAGLLLMAGLLPELAAAQVADAKGCPTEGEALASGSAPEVLAEGTRSAAAVALDTTFRISVERRRWSEPSVSAAVAAGVAGMENARWRACAGAWVEMRRVEMVIEGASGTVHVRSSPGALLQRLRARRLQPADNPGREET